MSILFSCIKSKCDPSATKSSLLNARMKFHKKFQEILANWNSLTYILSNSFQTKVEEYIMILKLLYWSTLHGNDETYVHRHDKWKIQETLLMSLIYEPYNQNYTFYNSKIRIVLLKNEGKFSNSRSLNETSPIGYELLRNKY